MNDVNLATKRTAINVGGLAAFIGLVAKLFGVDITVSADQLVALSPLIAAVVAVSYRVSRLLASKFPKSGWVLFGSGQEPAGFKKTGT